MKTRPLLWVVVGLFVVLHLFLHVGLGLGAVAPDLLTVALLLLAREVKVGVAAGTGFGLGLLEDALSVLSFGANAVAMSVTGALGALTRDLFVGDSLIFLVSYFALGKWLRDLLHWLVVGQDLRQSFVDQMLVQGSLAALYAAAVAVLALALTGLWGEPDA